MQKLLFTLTCIAGAFLLAACNPNKPNNPDNPNVPYNPEDHPEDASLSNWEKCLKYIQPGIYQGLTDEELQTGGMNMGYNNVILAICEDGTSFYVSNITNGTVIAPFTAFDGKLTFYNYGATKNDKGEFLYNKEIKTYSVDKLTSIGNATRDINSQLKLWAVNFGFDDYFYKGTMIQKYFRRIGEAKDFNSTYEKIFNLAKHQGAFTAEQDYFVTSHTIYGAGWHNELYPSDLNAKNWVIPYDGEGKIERFAVYRQRNWAYDDRWYLFYGPCNYGLVTWVECDVICDSDEAIRWYNKVATEAKYNRTNPNKTGIYPSYNDPEVISTVGYGYYSTGDDLDLSGYEGYICPTYEMIWLGGYNNFMTMKFGVEWVTYV